MTDRAIEIYADRERKEELEALAREHGALASWSVSAGTNRIHYHILTESHQTQPILDKIQSLFGKKEDFHLIVSSVEAYLPKPEISDDEATAKEAEKQQSSASIIREELENELNKSARFDRNFVVLVMLSTLVASIGMLENNVAVLVGSMVIAPFLGPNLALTFASAMGNKALVLKALKSLSVGSLIAFGCAVFIGQFWPIDTVPHELKMRAQVDYSAIFLALASGAAAVLSLTKGISSVLVGVMVAVALLPPLAASGLFVGHGMWPYALASLVLLAINIVCINLAGLTTFVLRGIGPRTWWQKRKAKQSVYIAISVWCVLLLGLAATIHQLKLLPGLL